MRKLILVTILFVCVATSVVVMQAISFVTKPAQDTKSEVTVDVEPGTSFYSLATKLEKQGVVRRADWFRWYAKLTARDSRLQVGEYNLTTSMTPSEVLDVVSSGKSITYSFTVPEGYNIYEIKEILNKTLPGRGDSFFNTVHDQKLIAELVGAKLSTLEGYIFPETYTITKYTTPEELVRQMVGLFKQNVEIAKQEAKINMPLHEHVTLASVIEKETGAPEERPLIASVFHNRLKKGMRLQSDPTIIYGMLIESGVLSKNIKKADILRSTPYNTYTVSRLPIGPIANPGLSALKAALNPVESEYLYFVSRNDGTHVFTSTYKDHDNAVKKFQIDRRMREGRSWRDLKKKKR